MSHIVSNEMVFYGNPTDIEGLNEYVGERFSFEEIVQKDPKYDEWTSVKKYQWIKENWGAQECVTFKKQMETHGSYSSLYLNFDCVNNIPLKIIENLNSRFPKLKSVHKATFESSWYESQYVRHDPSRGYQLFITHDPYGLNDSDGKQSFEVLDEFIEELKTDIELEKASEIIGVTLEWIESFGVEPASSLH